MKCPGTLPDGSRCQREARRDAAGFLRLCPPCEGDALHSFGETISPPRGPELSLVTPPPRPGPAGR